MIILMIYTYIYIVVKKFDIYIYILMYIMYMVYDIYVYYIYTH